MYVCVRERERDRQREKETETETERDTHRERGAYICRDPRLTVKSR